MKKTQNRSYTFFVCLLITAILSACTGKPAPINCASKQDFCVGLITQVGKINDQALNQMAWDGIQKAELKLNVHAQYIETVDSRDYEKNIASFANAGYDLIITVGYDQSKATLAAANKYPQINFIGVDQALEPDKSLPKNLAGLAFAEDQLGFLAGILATQMTKAKKVGAVCGPDFLDTAWRYCEGFKAGVDYVNNPPTPEPTATKTPRPTKIATNNAPHLSGTATPTYDPNNIEITPTDDPSIIECDPAVDQCDVPTDECDPTVDVCDPPVDDSPTDDPNATAEPDPTDEPAANFFSTNRYARDVHPQEEATPTEALAAEIPVSETRTPAAPTTLLAVTVTPTIEAIVVYHNEIGFKESPVNPKWDADTANTLMDGGVDVIFGADSYHYDENAAVSAAAKRYKYAIGVNTDQYLTISDARIRLISSVVKQVELGVFNLIRATKDGNFPSGNFAGSVGYAPYHELNDRVSALMRIQLAEVEKGLADGSIQTNVLWRKP